MTRFEIECGDFRKTIVAATPRAAWKYFSTGRNPERMAGIARFREVPWNGKFSWDPKEGHTRNGQWYYVEPSWFAQRHASGERA